MTYEGRQSRVALLVSRDIGARVYHELVQREDVVIVCTGVTRHRGDEDLRVSASIEGRELVALDGSEQLRGVYAEALAGEEVDAVLAAGWTQYVDERMRRAARWGVLAYHPSLLPRHRGADAVTWQCLLDERIVGGTVYQMDDGLDTGPILCQDWAHRAQGEGPKDLWRDKLLPIGVELLHKAATQCRFPYLPLKPQDERYSTYEPRLERPRRKEAT